MFGKKLKPEPKPERKMLWDYPPPVGYAWAPTSDSMVPLVCTSCGASVTPSAAERHGAWHEATWDQMMRAPEYVHDDSGSSLRR